MRQILLAFSILIFTNLSAQDDQKIKIQYGKPLKNCISPEGNKFSINYKLFDLKLGKRDSTMVKVRLPFISDDVTVFNSGVENPNKLELKCFPFLNGAKIIEVELGDVSIVPHDAKILETVKVKSNASSNLFKNPGGREFCISISAITNTPGKYKVELPIRAKVKLGFLPAVWAKCDLKNVYFNAKK